MRHFGNFFGLVRREQRDVHSFRQLWDNVNKLELIRDGVVINLYLGDTGHDASLARLSQLFDPEQLQDLVDLVQHQSHGLLAVDVQLGLLQDVVDEQIGTCFDLALPLAIQNPNQAG